MKFLSSIFLFFAVPAFSLLSPLNQSIVELETLLHSNELQDLLGSGQVIEDIIRTPKGYVVLTPNYHLQVDIDYSHSKRIGPAQFELRFQSPIRRDNTLIP